METVQIASFFNSLCIILLACGLWGLRNRVNGTEEDTGSFSVIQFNPGKNIIISLAGMPVSSIDGVNYCIDYASSLETLAACLSEKTNKKGK